MVTELASVRVIAGPSRIEQVRDEIVALIERGELLPGEEISLREIAERDGLSLAALINRFQGRRYQELCTIRGDRVVVAPLAVDSVRRALHLRGELERDLLARSVGLVPPEQLRRLAVGLPDPAEGALDPLGFTKALAVFEQEVHAAATRFEREVLADIFALGRRFISFTARGIDNGLLNYHRSPETVRQNCVHLSLETLSTLASGNIASLRNVREHYRRDYAEMVHLAMDFDIARLPPHTGSVVVAERPPSSPARIIEFPRSRTPRG